MATGRRLSYCNPRLLRTVFLQLQQQQEAGHFCDVTLQCDGDGLHVHSCVVAACSPYLARHLKCSGKMSSSSTDSGAPDLCSRQIISLGGIPGCYLFPLVRYMYTSELEVAPADAHGVLRAAKKLQIPELESLSLEGGRFVRKESGRKLNRGCLGGKKQTPDVHYIQHFGIEQLNNEDDAHNNNTPFNLEAVNKKSSSQCLNDLNQASMIKNEPCMRVMVTCNSPKVSPHQSGSVSNEQNESEPEVLKKDEKENEAIFSVSGNGLAKRRKLNRERKLNISAPSRISRAHGVALDNGTIATSTTKETEKQTSQAVVKVLSNTKSTLATLHNLKMSIHDTCKDIPCKEETGQLEIVAPMVLIDERDFEKDKCLSIEVPENVVHTDLASVSKVHSELMIKCTVDKDSVDSISDLDMGLVNKGSAEEAEEITNELLVHEVEKMKLRKLKNGQEWEIVKVGEDEQELLCCSKLQNEEYLTEIDVLLQQMCELPSPVSDVDVGGYSPMVGLGEGVWPDLSSESDEEIDVLH